MAYTEGSRIVLDEHEMDAFLQRVNHPDPDAIRRRDELFAMLDQLELSEEEDGSFSFEFAVKPVEKVRSTRWEKQRCAPANQFNQTEKGAEITEVNADDLLAA